MSKIPGKVLNTEQADFLELSQELLDRGSLLRFQAHGRSMYPFIKNGDIVVVESKDGRSVSPGDIIFYHLPGGPLTAHRLIKIIEKKDRTDLVTKGDALVYVDQRIASGQVLGRVITIEGQGRIFRLNSWPGRLFGRLTAWTANGRFRGQGRIVRYIDRFGRLLLGRRIK